MSAAAALLAELVRRGIELQPHGDRLRYRPKAAMTPELAERVKAHQPELLAALAAGRAPVGEQFQGGDMQIGHQRPALAVLKSNEHVVPQGHDQPGVADVVVRSAGQNEPEGLKRVALKPVADVVGPHAPSIPREPSLAERVESGYVNRG